MERNFEKIVWTNSEIIRAIDRIADNLNLYYKSYGSNHKIMVISVLDGSLVFTGNIINKLEFNLILKTAKISLYGSKLHPKKENLVINLNFEKELIKDKRILILEDLIDTGMTLDIFKNYLYNNGAYEVKICSLFKKDISARKNHVEVDWYGLDVPNAWVAGFGIDSRDKYRNFKHLGIVKIDCR